MKKFKNQLDSNKYNHGYWEEQYSWGSENGFYHHGDRVGLWRLYYGDNLGSEKFYNEFAKEVYIIFFKYDNNNGLKSKQYHAVINGGLKTHFEEVYPNEQT